MRVYITAINQAEQSRAFLQSVLLHLLVSLVLDSPPQETPSVSTSATLSRLCELHV